MSFHLHGGELTENVQRTLTDANVDDFIIVEYKDEIGGRVHHEDFGRDKDGEPLLVEYGANWIQGLGGNGNPGMLPFSSLCGVLGTDLLQKTLSGRWQVTNTRASCEWTAD